MGNSGAQHSRPLRRGPTHLCGGVESWSCGGGLLGVVAVVVGVLVIGTLGYTVLGVPRVRASDNPASQPVLHQPVPDITAEEVQAALVRHGLAGAGSPGRAPLGDGPALTGEGSDSGRGTGQDTPGRRTSRFRPDRQTGLSDPQPYTASFDPSVAPFKRVSAFDGLTVAADGRTPLLVVAQPNRRLVHVLQRSRVESGYTRFVGEAEVNFSAGPAVPLPTVAPEVVMRQLAVLPPGPIEVERDGADNYVLVLHGPAPQQPVRVSFEMDVPDAYFGAPVPAVPLRELPPLTAALPRGIRRRGLQVASKLGVTRSSDLRTAVHRLTRHFRSFEESQEPPRDSGDVYADLALGKKGICRHRAYGFAVTALSLGIQTRFVQNEAHSFVEVKLPETGYMRIDLGGAAGGLSASSSHARTLHKPRTKDALPRPPSYEQSYAQATMGAQAAVEPGALGVRAGVGRWLPQQTPEQVAMDAALRGMEHGATPLSPSSRPLRSRAPLYVSLSKVPHMALRGETLSLSGKIQDADHKGVADLMVEASLGLSSRDDRFLLGYGKTDANGMFALELHIPQHVQTADYELHVGTPGNAMFAPAEAP